MTDEILKTLQNARECIALTVGDRKGVLGRLDNAITLRRDELEDRKVPQHPDDAAVDAFAAAMKAKLAKKRDEGRGGWQDKSLCSAEYLTGLLHDHVEKGDPLDVGNVAMMLHQRGEQITARKAPDDLREMARSIPVEEHDLQCTLETCLPDGLAEIIIESVAGALRDARASAVMLKTDAGGWLTIDSAPRDGSDIQLAAIGQVFQGKPVEDRVTIGHWSTDEECREQIGDCGGECRCPEYRYHSPSWLSWDGGFDAENPPTHWKPLSAAPQKLDELAAPDDNIRLSPLALDILRACAGEIVQLPYNDEHEVEKKTLIKLGLIVSIYEDDCPPSITTAKGNAYLAAIRNGGSHDQA